MRGSTRVTMSGEGLESYGRTLDLINQRLSDDNLVGISSVWYYNIGEDFLMPSYGLHQSANDARALMRSNVRCSFGALGHVAADSIDYAGWCFLPAQLSLPTQVEYFLNDGRFAWLGTMLDR